VHYIFYKNNTTPKTTLQLSHLYNQPKCNKLQIAFKLFSLRLRDTEQERLSTWQCCITN